MGAVALGSTGWARLMSLAVEMPSRAPRLRFRPNSALIPSPATTTKTGMETAAVTLRQRGLRLKLRTANASEPRRAANQNTVV
ncbi:hypothetical protein PJL18_04228 [Paenarthrobacter nicotinovorans]|nr:hypothetical protein [Paenarthrobacter nicotinovorans]